MLEDLQNEYKYKNGNPKIICRTTLYCTENVYIGYYS